MKIKSLEAFCAAVEERSISGAARRMYLSQPSVSERLAELEREARVMLLRRSRTGVEPTLEGASFYEHARKVLDEVKTLESTLRALRSKDDMKLRFASCVTVGERLLPECLRRFDEKMPDAVPMVFMGNDAEVANVVRTGEVPIGVVATDIGNDSFDAVPIMDDDVVLVVAPEHPWASREVGPEDLPKERFISRETGSTMKAAVDRKLEELGGIKLNTQMELRSTTAIKEIVEEGWAFAMFSRADIQRKLKTGALVEVAGFSIPWTYKLIRHPSATLSPAEISFCDFLLGARRQVGGKLRNRALQADPPMPAAVAAATAGV